MDTQWNNGEGEEKSVQDVKAGARRQYEVNWISFFFKLSLTCCLTLHFNTNWHVWIYTVVVLTHVACATVWLCVFLHTCVDHRHLHRWVMGRKQPEEKQQLLRKCKHSDTSKVEIKVMTNCGCVCSILSQILAGLQHASQETLQSKFEGNIRIWNLSLQIFTRWNETFLLETNDDNTLAPSFA